MFVGEAVLADALFRKIDCLEIPVPNLEDGLAFYRDRLGHELIWRTATAAGLRLPDSNAEIVLQTERPRMEAALTVASVDAAVNTIVEAGGRVIVPPFDIPIGRCVVVADPWGNRLVLLDNSKGHLATDASGVVVGTVDAPPLPRGEAAQPMTSAQPMFAPRSGPMVGRRGLGEGAPT